MPRQTLFMESVEPTVDEIIKRLGKTINVGMPLGLGKPPELINALYQRAKADPELKLTILTALSLEKPTWSNDLERRFIQPIVERIYGDCPDLDYMHDLRRKKLPANIEIREFFFKPGSSIGNAHAQHHYINSNYTHAARDVFENGCNLAMQIIAKQTDAQGNTRYSTSCNPDTGPELIELLEESGREHLVVGSVNEELPFMTHDAEVGAEFFDIVLQHPDFNTKLFSTPKLAVTTPDYMIGLNASALIKDGGTLQIGIGALGDAIVYALQLRHQQNATYKQSLVDAGIADKSQELINNIGGVMPFEKGLYGATEMFVDGFLHLYKAGILKRKVYDFWALQKLINDGRVDPDNLKPDVFAAMEALGVRVLRTKDFEVLQYHGLFNDECSYDQGYIIDTEGNRVIANLANPQSRDRLASCLGDRLRNGIVLHGGFFLGPNDFYQSLRDMTPEKRAEIGMTGVYKVNQLDHNPRLYKAQRKDARFVNTGIIATMSGAVVSDGLENGQVISGVGGQYNFVAMAHHLRTGRSILMVRSVREKGGEAISNVLWSYGHCTIPRHLRDIVITEYGIAELRSKTDSEVIKALLNITDSRFQNQLLQTAKAAGKLEAGYEIPEAHRNNTPQRLEATLTTHRKTGLFPAFPFGTDFTDEELALGKALKGVAARVAGKKLPVKAILDAFMLRQIPAGAQPWLERMELTKPTDFKEKLAQKLLVLELQAAGKI